MMEKIVLFQARAGIVMLVAHFAIEFIIFLARKNFGVGVILVADHRCRSREFFPANVTLKRRFTAVDEFVLVRVSEFYELLVTSRTLVFLDAFVRTYVDFELFPLFDFKVAKMAAERVVRVVFFRMEP